jgi:hypothetical protein
MTPYVLLLIELRQNYGSFKQKPTVVILSNRGIILNVFLAHQIDIWNMVILVKLWWNNF